MITRFLFEIRSKIRLCFNRANSVHFVLISLSLLNFLVLSPFSLLRDTPVQSLTVF